MKKGINNSFWVAVFIALAIASLFTTIDLPSVSLSFAQPPTPARPVPDLPRVKPPGIPPKPDLLMIDPFGGGLGGISDLYPDNPGMGPSVFEVRGFVLNGSSAAAVGGFEIAVFLSQDRKVSPDDRLMGTIVITETISPPAPGRPGIIAIPRTTYSIVGVPAGGYFICARVDPRNRIIETDENNNDNCVDRSIRIYPPGTR